MNMDLRMLETENEEQYTWRLGQAKDSGEIDLSWDQIADIINNTLYEDKPFSASAFRKPYQAAKRYYEAGVFGNVDKAQAIGSICSQYGTETRINKDGSYSSSKLIEMNEMQSKDPVYLLNAHGFDPTKWKIVSAKNNIRQAISSSDGIVTLYASFLTVKPLSENEITFERIDEFFNRLDREYSKPDVQLDDSVDLGGDELLLLDIADLHMNLQASVFTTGNEYNCDIAEKLLMNAIANIIERTGYYNFDEIVLTIGGDMLNGDNMQGSTTKGTPQVSDLHYYDAYERLCEMTIKVIDILKDRARVNVIYVPGNHDEMTGYKLAKYIDAWYRHDDMVTVDYQPIARKYKLFGSTLLCFMHDGKVQKLPAIIADEARKYWSHADMVEVFLQHLHTEQILMEENNIRIQRLPTISARSKWSSDQGYNSKRQFKFFVFDKEFGLSDVFYVPIKAIES